MPSVTLSTNGDGQPRLAIVVEGDGNVYAYAWRLANSGDLPLAKRVFKYLKRRWGAEIFREHDRRYTGGKVTEFKWER